MMTKTTKLKPRLYETVNFPFPLNVNDLNKKERGKRKRWRSDEKRKIEQELEIQ